MRKAVRRRRVLPRKDDEEIEEGSAENMPVPASTVAAASSDEDEEGGDVTVLGDPTWLRQAADLDGRTPNGHKRNDLRKDLAVRAVESGLTRASAAELIGVSVDTLSEWAKEDPRFASRLLMARGRGVARAASRLQMLIAQGDVAAIMFFLRTRTTEFRERQEVIYEDDGLNRDERFL